MKNKYIFSEKEHPEYYRLSAFLFTHGHCRYRYRVYTMDNGKDLNNWLWKVDDEETN